MAITDEPVRFCVYLLTNTVTGKKYVGKTNKFNLRWYQHKKEAGYAKDNILLHKSIRKHGSEVFTHELIEWCETEESSLEREMFWIAKLKTKVPNGYNLTDGGEGQTGLKHSEETKRKMSIASTGRKLPTRTESQRKSYSDAVRSYYQSHTHVQKGVPRVDIAERFFSYVNKNGPIAVGFPDTCHVWTGSQTTRGYGVIDVATMGGQKRVSQMALFLANGAWPTPPVAHTCGNHLCVNLSHLIESTWSDVARSRKKKAA